MTVGILRQHRELNWFFIPNIRKSGFRDSSVHVQQRHHHISGKFRNQREQESRTEGFLYLLLLGKEHMHTLRFLDPAFHLNFRQYHIPVSSERLKPSPEIYVMN